MKENFVIFYTNSKKEQKIMMVSMPNYVDVTVDDLQDFFKGFGAKLLRIERYNALVGAYVD